jgi:hypothetical protein
MTLFRDSQQRNEKSNKQKILRNFFYLQNSMISCFGLGRNSASTLKQLFTTEIIFLSISFCGNGGNTPFLIQVMAVAFGNPVKGGDNVINSISTIPNENTEKLIPGIYPKIVTIGGY